MIHVSLFREMNLTIMFFNLICSFYSASGTEWNSVKFIKEFIENENKPTQLIYDLCWNEHENVKFTNELCKMSIRSTPSLESVTKYQENIILFLIDLNCNRSELILLNAKSKNLFKFPYRWLALFGADDSAQRLILNTLWDMPLSITSDLVLAEGSEDQYTLVELHKPAANGVMVFTPRGYYNNGFVDARPHRELYRRRRDLKGHPLTMANVIQDSNITKYYLPKDDRADLHNDAVAKVCWVFAKIAFEMLNATPKYIFSYRWGYKVNGSWSGMVRDVGENRADLGTNCVLFKERLEMITYTDLVAPMRMRFVFRQPPLAYVTNIFSLPFSSGVWLAIIICSLISTIALYLTSIWEVKMAQSRTQLDGSIGDAFLLTMSAVTQQGCFIEPKKTPGRILVWVMFAALMALYVAYSANIVVLLQAPSKSINNLAQLANSKITLAANDVDYNRFVLNDDMDALHISVHKAMLPEKGKTKYFDIVEGVEKIRQGLFAIHSIVEPVYRRVEETFLESEKCDLTEVDYINSLDAFTPVKKDSPYLELLRVVYKQIRESGIQAALNKRYQVPKPHCQYKVFAFNSVGLLDIRPVILLMLYGVTISVIIAIIEMIVFKISKRRCKPNENKNLILKRRPL